MPTSNFDGARSAFSQGAVGSDDRWLLDRQVVMGRGAIAVLFFKPPPCCRPKQRVGVFFLHLLKAERACFVDLVAASCSKV